MNAPTVLVTPPWQKACEPDPAVLALAGFLTAHGAAAEVFDANLAYQEALLSPERLGKAARALAGGNVPAAWVTSARRSVTHGPAAWAALRDPAVYDNGARYRQALAAHAEALQAPARAHGVTLTPSDFVHPALSPLSSRDLAEAFRDPSRLPEADLLAALARDILARAPGVVGLSASYLSQALFTYALAGLLRREGFGGLLLLGGGLATSWSARLNPASAALDPWDAVVWGPGEEILLAASREGRIPDLPGVLAPGRGVWRPPGEAAPPRRVSFAPELSGPRWGGYLAPGGILPVAASRGCYWARCAFCPEAGRQRQPYRAARGGDLAGLLEDARERLGLSRVHLTDNAVSPAHLRRLARRLAGRGIRWYGFARVEKALAEPGFLDELARGGCAMLQLGIESASRRLLDRMGKGVDPDLADEVARRARDAGIRVYGYFLFGSPTETADEARRTLDWVRRRADALTFLNLSLMNLPRAGDIAATPEGYGVDRLWEKDGENDLSLYVGFSGAETVDRRELRKLLAEARREPELKAALARAPRGFGANHAAFAPL